jgi:serine-type D-Ala-D-Ala carboxypeptidase/endopeptidase (penicillin-binding protein 4)
VMALNAESPFVLASTTKVVTSLAALDLLGPQYRWRTFAFASGPVNEGRLLGDLVIVGGGNVRLSSADLLAWFARLRDQGLQEVWGDIVLDRFAFRLSEADHANLPPPTPQRPHYARPDALMLDEGVLRVAMQANGQGQPGLRLTPAISGLRVANQVRGGKGDCSARVDIEQAGGELKLVARGHWATGCGEREIAQLALPHAEFTAMSVGGLWRDAGGKLKGRVVDRNHPDRDTLYPRGADGEAIQPWAVHLSPPLLDVVYDINKSSDNLAARNLMLSLAPDFPMRAATLANARARLEQWLRRQGINPGDIEVETGAGLSHAERGKPRALVQLLRNAWHARQAQAFVATLPIAGVDGTLAGRMTSGDATGHAHLKTGTLHNTRALAGYVHARSGKVYAVALMINHPGAERATGALDGIIEWMVRQG